MQKAEETIESLVLGVFLKQLFTDTVNELIISHFYLFLLQAN